MEEQRYRILDLFSGAGGLSVGLDMVDGFNTVIATDFMKDALDTFALNFPQAEVVYGDIRNEHVKQQIVDKSKAARVNMIVGGPPCQGYSNKGKKLGLRDPRNFLFREYLDVVEKIQPEVFVIENVKALSTSSNGWFINEILAEIKKLGYKVNWGILTASDFGVPQQRQRTIIIACKNNVISLPVSKNIKKNTVRDAISDLAYLNSGEGADVQEYKNPPMSKYQKEMRKGSVKLYNHKATNHTKIALEKLSMIPPEGGKESLPQDLLGNQKFKTTWGRLKWNSQSPTIDTRFDTPSNGTNSHPELNRAITPREAARLQSFPDTFRFIGSKTNICKQIGNAVPPLLGKAVAEAIISNASTDAVYKRKLLFNGNAFSVLDDLQQRNMQVDHIITDPPYNISKNNHFSTMKTANRTGVDFGDWDKEFDLISWIPKAEKILKPGGTFIIFNSYRNFTPIIEALESCGIIVKDILKWVKSNPMPRNINRRYVQDTEFAIWGVKSKKPWVFNLPQNKKYLRAEFHTSTVSGNERVKHPTQKSLKLMETIISIHTNKNDLIFDPFMGSGTTGVASIRLKRNFIGIELDKNYFEIAKKRIEDEE
jgi:DNA (cytosine-5)-methyltransferase 1